MFLKKILFIYFRDRGRKKEREGEKHGCEREHQLLPLVCSPAGDGTHNPGTYPDWELNWQPSALWDNAQPIEPHLSG